MTDEIDAALKSPWVDSRTFEVTFTALRVTCRQYSDGWGKYSALHMGATSGTPPPVTDKYPWDFPIAHTHIQPRHANACAQKQVLETHKPYGSAAHNNPRSFQATALPMELDPKSRTDVIRDITLPESYKHSDAMVKVAKNMADEVTGSRDPRSPASACCDSTCDAEVSGIYEMNGRYADVDHADIYTLHKVLHALHTYRLTTRWDEPANKRQVLIRVNGVQHWRTENKET